MYCKFTFCWLIVSNRRKELDLDPESSGSDPGIRMRTYQNVKGLEQWFALYILQFVAIIHKCNTELLCAC